MSVLRIEARGFCMMRLRCGGAASDRHAWSPEVLDLEAMRCGLSATVAVAALSAPRSAPRRVFL